MTQEYLPHCQHPAATPATWLCLGSLWRLLPVTLHALLRPCLMSYQLPQTRLSLDSHPLTRLSKAPLSATSYSDLHTWKGAHRSTCSINYYLLFNNLLFCTSLYIILRWWWVEDITTKMINNTSFFLLPISLSASFSYSEIITALDRNRCFFNLNLHIISKTGLGPANKSTAASEK